MGATAPFSIVGTVVDFNVENLAAIVVIQIIHPGSAVCYHTVSQSFNMKSGLSSLGGPEKILGALAGAEMGRFYNLPSGSAGSATNSLEYDIQNGAETMSQLLLAVSGSANIVTGIGSLGNAMAASAEQILFDCELIALAEYLRKGIEIDEERLAFQAFQRVGPGKGFLEDELTLKLLRSKEHFLAGSFNLSPSGKEAVSMYERLHAHAQEIIKEHKPAIPEERIADLRKYVSKRKTLLS